MSVPLFYIGLAGVPANLMRWWHAVKFVQDHLMFIHNHPNAWRAVSFFLAVCLAFFTQLRGWLRPAVAVDLVPTSGASQVMELQVRNSGKPREFYAECTLLTLRNSPNALRKRVSALKWEHSDTKYTLLGTGESSNLLVARFTIDHKAAFGEVEILGLLGGVAGRIEWAGWVTNSREKFPEYDLLITVFGSESRKPFEKRFTLRPAKWIGPLEMVEIGKEVKPNAG